MNLSAVFIKRPVMTSLIMLAAVVFGILSYRLMPVAAIPTIAFPTIEVTVSYPGASPDEMSRLVASPLEREFMIMQGIKTVASNNTYETTECVLQFHLDIDINVAAENVQEAINQAMGQLPKDLPQAPIYKKMNPSDTPILYLAIHSDTVPPWTLYEYGYSFIGQQLGTVEGIADLQTYGFPYAVRVKVDPESLAAKDISLTEVAEAIKGANPDKPTGKFYGPQHSIMANADGQLDKAEMYNSMIIKYQDGQPVRLRDLGHAYDSLQNDKQNFKWVTPEGPESLVVVAIYRQPGYNTVQICNNITNLISKLSKDIPASMHLEIPYNQSWWILQAVADVELTLLVAFALVVLVVFFYLGKVRNSIIPLISLPITLTATLILMYLFGYSIDIFSLSAFTLSIGFLVDDAIVVLENIVRRIQYGESPYEGAKNGSKQISVTIFSISLCLAAVFVPMILLGGVMGRILHEFAAVIIISVLISGFISLSLTPMLCSRFVPPYKEQKKLWLERFAEGMNNGLIKIYKPILTFFLKHKVFTLFLGFLSIAISGYLFIKIPKSFLPVSDLGFIQCFVETQEGTSPEKMNEYMTKIGEMAIDNPYVYAIARIDSFPTDDQSIFFMNLIPLNKRPSCWKIIADMNKEFEEIPGVRIFMKPFPLINLQVGSQEQAKAQNQFVLQSYDTELLYGSARKLLEEMKQNPAFADVSSDMQIDTPVVNLKLLRDRAHAYGDITADDIETALMYAYGESYISNINVPQDMYYVILQVENEYQTNPAKIDTLYIGSKNDPVAMSSVVEVEEGTGAQTVNHINTLTSVVLSFNTGSGYALSDTLQELDSISADILPARVDGTIAGNTAAFKETIIQMQYLVIFAIFVIYLILGILYENFLLPIAPLSALPIAMIGGILTLFIFGESLSLYGFIGLMMLLGIVMKNGILVVDFALDEMEHNKKEPYDAIFTACIVRFRPIFMTTLAAMMGAVPIALGIGGTVSAGRAPLGMVVIGGLLFSQLVTLLITPVIFLYLIKIQKFFQRKTDFFDDELKRQE